MKTVQHWTLTRTPWSTRISQETEMNFIEISSFSYSILNYTLLKSYQSYCEFLMTRFFVLNFFCRDARLTCICYNFCLSYFSSFLFFPLLINLTKYYYILVWLRSNNVCSCLLLLFWMNVRNTSPWFIVFFVPASVEPTRRGQRSILALKA
jgi:hypothetical protein